MTPEQYQHVIQVIDHIEQIAASAYSMIGFVVCVVLPLLGLVWFLKKVFSPFFGEYF